MSNTCETHQREANIYDLQLHLAICQRCALFHPAYKGHSFLEVSQLPQHAHTLYKDFSDRLASLKIQREMNGINCKEIRDATGEKIASEVALVNQTYDQMVKEIEKEREAKIGQTESQIKGLAEESKKSMKTLVQSQYLQLVNLEDTLKTLMNENKSSEICKALSSHSLTTRIDAIEKDLAIIKLEFTNKLAFASYDSPFFLPLPVTRQQSIKEENLINNIENEFVTMFDSLRYSRVSEKSICNTQISFCSFPTIESETKRQSSLRESTVSLQTGLHVLKVHTKSQIKSLYIKNSIKQISLCQLSMNNRQAMDAVRKCSQNNFVSKIDLSDNQLSQKFITQLKREKVQSKYLKKIVAKGMRIDIRQLKKQGMVVNTTASGSSTVVIGDITVQF